MVTRQPGSLNVETGEVGPLFIVPDQGLNLAAARTEVFWTAMSFCLQPIEHMSLTKAALHRAAWPYLGSSVEDKDRWNTNT